METITVGVLASDPVTQQGTMAQLSSYPELRPVPSDRAAECQVLLVLVGEVTDETLFAMQRAYRARTPETLSVVLVTNVIPEHQVLRAVNCGLTSLLFRQETGFDRIVQAIVAASAGRAVLPGNVTRCLIDQVRRVQEEFLAQHSARVKGMAAREIEVLRLVADGLDTSDVAQELNYSERTVKTIIHDIVTRFKLRNRTHAVAYAMRCGVL
jgi:DNA-binding NarL/FixJ family response regulator